MFDIGFTELILLGGLGLLVLGPQRLPKVAAQLGRWVGQARRMSRTLMYQLRQEVDLDDPRPFSARRPAQPASTKANTMHQQAGSDKKDAESDETATPATDGDESDETVTPATDDAESDETATPATDDAESDETATPATDGAESDETATPATGGDGQDKPSA